MRSANSPNNSLPVIPAAAITLSASDAAVTEKPSLVRCGIIWGSSMANGSDPDRNAIVKM